MIKYHIYPAASPALPVMLSHKMREVMISPAQENIRSKSGWAMCFGNPDTYRLAPFIASLLGRAYDTCNHDFNQSHERISHKTMVDLRARRPSLIEAALGGRPKVASF